MVHSANRSQEGDISFHFHHSAPCFLKAFDMGDVLPPLHSPALRSGDTVSPTAKAEKTTGASVKLFKEISPSCERLPFAPCRRSGLPFFGVLGSGPDCTASPVRDE